jgi:hypothetical protein
MSDDNKEEKRRPGVPKYFYWAKKAPKPKKAQVGFVNRRQRSFYFVQLAFRTAKVTAIVVAFLLFYSRI